jgi:hypothetical protein
MDPSAISAFGRLLAGNFAAGDSAADLPSLSSLFASLRNTDLERGFFGSASFELESLSLLSVDALDALLSEGSFAIDSEDSLLTSLLRLGPDYSPLLRHVKWPLVRPELVLDFAEREADVPPEAFWRVFQSSLTLLPVYALDSMIVADFPQIFSGFARKAFNLLWRGTRDGFSADIFHHYCDGHANTLTIITDTDGNIFGGFTPAKWESGTWHPIMDPSLTSFLFTLKNPHDFPAKTFALNPNGKEPAIVCDSAWGPCFGDIVVTSNCNSTIDNYTIGFGSSYVNDTGIDKSVFFSGLWHFTVKEIEVFEITERAAPDARLYIQCAELPRTVYDNV